MGDTEVHAPCWIYSSITSRQIISAPLQKYLFLLRWGLQLSCKELCLQTVLEDLWWFVCVWKPTCPKWQPRGKNKQRTLKKDKTCIPCLGRTSCRNWLLTEQHSPMVAHPKATLISFYKWILSSVRWLTASFSEKKNSWLSSEILVYILNWYHIISSEEK